METRRSTGDSMEVTILQAAEEMFLSRGYNAVSTTDIAKSVGCNQALIHYYYRTKSKLFTRVLERKLGAVMEIVRTKFEAGMPFEEKMARVVELHIDFLKENPRLPLFFLEEARNNDEAIEIIRQAFFDHKGELLESLQRGIDEEAERGGIVRMDAFDLMMDIVSLNIFPFLVNPIIRNVLKMGDEEYGRYIDGRKAEIVRLIMGRLRNG